MTKVKKITVSNLKSISSLTADFNGCTAIITGGNNKGKSSFLRSLPERLRGNKNGLILKEGEAEGSAEFELTTGEKFIWTFDGKKEKLTYISERNIPQSVTKDISKTYFPDLFDVDTFLNDAPQKQNKKLQELSGIDFTEIDKEYQAAYEARTYSNKRVVETKAKLVFYDPKEKTELIPFETLETELNGIDAHNLRYQGVKEKADAKHIEVKKNLDDIAEYLQKIEALKERNGILEDELAKGEVWLNDEKNKEKTNADELKAKIAEIKAKNLIIEDNNKAKLLDDEYVKALANAKEADDEVKRLEDIKKETIKMAALPDGFGFSDTGITYNGFPFDRGSLSSSGIYIGALKLAATQLGTVKTLYFDASFLDKNSLSEIEKWANSQDLQLLIERPDFEGGEIHYELTCKS